jgi:hypothetical protein
MNGRSVLSKRIQDKVYSESSSQIRKDVVLVWHAVLYRQASSAWANNRLDDE